MRCYHYLGKEGRCGAETDGRNVLSGYYGRPYRLCPEHLAEYEAKAVSLAGWHHKLTETTCEGCGVAMRVDQRLRRYRYSGENSGYWWPYVARFCESCLPEARRSVGRESNRRWRENTKLREGQVEQIVCAGCKTEIEGVAYRQWSRGRFYCATCEARDQLAGVEYGWKQSVEQGTPGTVKGMFSTREVEDPETFVPLAADEVGACEVCGRETSPPRRMEERREVVWCGRVECRVEATRLAKRVPVKEPRSCEFCGESFEPSRSDQRFCSTAHRAAAHRERVAGEKESSTAKRSRERMPGEKRGPRAPALRVVNE